MECQVNYFSWMESRKVTRARDKVSSRLLHPIHGPGVFQRSNIISNLIGCMCRMLAAESIVHNKKNKPGTIAFKFIIN
jgi:hypothetical protein